MKILLDENLPHKLRPMLMPMHEPHTVAHLGWKGISNGKLLTLAAAQGFGALITTDQSLEHQQNAATLPCSIVILAAKSNKLDDLRPLVPRLLVALATLGPHRIITIT